MQHKLYTAALSAFNNLSHDPERRAAAFCAGFDTDTDRVASLGGDVAKLERLAIAWLAAKARCASPMIVGPARFPVARMAKLNRYEMAHCERYHNFIKECERRFCRASAPPPLTLSEKLAAARAEQARLKALPISERRHGFELTYATNLVRDLERQAAAVERMAPTEGAPYQADGLRVWFTFEGKPPEATRDVLKANGFKWTPSKGHWGRQLTPNALAAAARVAKHLEA